MTNEGSWQPPQPVPAASATPPSPRGPQPPPPTGWGADPVQPNPPARARRSKGTVIAAIVGVVVLLAAGIFAITRLTGGGSSAGGASSPEDAGLALLTALDNEDMLGAIDVLLPGERETFRDPASDLAEELRRIEVLSEDADLSDVGGLEIELADEDVETKDTSVDDLVELRLSGQASAAVDGDDLPLGDLVLDNAPDDRSELDVEQTDRTEFDVPMMAVEEDGRWYVSLFYTAAEQLRQSADAGDIPAEGITPTGGDSPEDAVDTFLNGVETLDLEAMIASLNPDEFQALQRYAPLFLDDAQDEIDEADVEISLDDPEYEVGGDGDRRSITVTSLAGSLTFDGETAEVAFEDGCYKVTPPEGEGEPFDSCELQEQSAEELDEFFGDDSEQVQELLDEFATAFDDYENPGFIVERVDGSWYVSPMATVAEQVLAVVRALDREEIESITDTFSDVFEDLLESVPGAEFPDDEFFEDLGPTDDTTDEGAADVTMPDFTIPEITIPDFGTVPDFTNPDSDSVPDATLSSDQEAENEAASACLAAESVDDAVACYDALIETGEISPSTAPVYLRAPECGLAEAYWSGELFSLPDDEFIALVEPAAPCFQDLVADGTLAEFDLPLELSNPDCLEGKNWYLATEDDAYFDRLLECAYG